PRPPWKNSTRLSQRSSRRQSKRPAKRACSSASKPPRSPPLPFHCADASDWSADMELAFPGLSVLGPADAQDVWITATHHVFDVDAAGLTGVDGRGRGIAEDDHAGVFADGVKGDFMCVLVAGVRHVDPVAGVVGWRSLPVLGPGLARFLAPVPVLAPPGG